jgi:oligopeptide transport system substrate-binding protein
VKVGKPLIFIVVFLILCVASSWAEEPGPETLRIAIENLAYRFDPHVASSDEAQIISALGEGVVGRDPVTLEPAPGVANSWERSEDGRHYTFFLRTEALFDNGEPVLAADIRESWLRLLAPATGSQYGYLLDRVSGAREFRTGRNGEDDVGIFVRAPRILDVELIDPDPMFLSILAHFSLVPLHRSRRTPPSDGDSILPLIGNGPYRLESTNEPLSLIRNDSYWDSGSVQIARVEAYRELSPEETSIRFNSGKLDWAIDEFSVERLSDIESIRLNEIYATTYFYFGANRWPDYRLRVALVAAIPFDELRPQSRFMRPTSVLVPASPLYPSVTGIEEVGLSETDALLREAGLIGGARPVRAITVWTNETRENRRIADVLQSAWGSRLGISVEVDSSEGFGGPADTTDGEVTVGLETARGSYFDPGVFLERWRSDTPRNPSGFADERFDRLLDTASALSGSARMQAFADAEQLLLDSATVVPISHLATVHLIDTERIGGWHENPLDIHPFKHLRRLTASPAPGIALLREFLASEHNAQRMRERVPETATR